MSEPGLTPAAGSRPAGWEGRRVCVSGAAGFIGSHLTEALVRRGARVRGFIRYNSRNHYGWLETADPDVVAEVEIFTGDLTNPEACRRAADSCDVFFHLGALIPIPYSYRHPREFVTTNVEGTLNVLEACRATGVERLVHTSTSETYGSARWTPIDEEHPLQAQSPYAASKVGADKLALSYYQSFHLPVVVVRPFNTFGPRQSARALIPTVITAALTRDVIELGATWPTRDFVYVSDTVEGMIAAGERAGVEGEVINLGTGREISVGETAARILALLGQDRPIVESPKRLRPRQSEVERLVADRSKALHLLGWEPTVAFDDGLLETIDWVRSFLSLYKPELYNV